MALKLKGSTSGFVAIDAPSVAGNNTLILPENTGSAHQILANDITAGVTTFTQITVSRNGDLTVPGTISIGGTLTYEDVTSVDSVGIVTARGLSIFGNTTGLQVASGISTFQAVTGTTGTFSGAVSGTTGTFTDDIQLNADTKFLQIGASQDLDLHHNGTNSFIRNKTGNLHIRPLVAEEGIILKPNAAVELYYNNTKTFETTSTGVKTLGDVSLRTSSNTQTILYDESDGQLEFVDNIKASFGTGGDLLIHHNGSVNVIDAATSAAISFRYGGSEQFFIGNAEFKGGDNKRIKLGTGDDLQIYHDTESYIKSATASVNLILESAHDVYIKHGGENMIKCAGDGAVELYHNGTKMVETTATGTSIPDGKFAMFGASNDMTMGHNTYNYITYTGADFLLTGDATNQIKLQPKSDEPALICKPNAEVELYYNASVQAETQDGGFRIRGKNYTCHQSGDMDSTVNMKVCFYQLIAASGSHTFQAGSTYSMGTVTIHGSRGTPANNATLATGKIFPIHIRAGATSGLGSQIGADLGGASGGFSYSVAAASQGITVTNSSSTYAMKCFVTFDLTGFV